MKLDIVDIKGKKTGKQVTLSDYVFGITPNEHAMYLAVKQFMGNQRQGTHKTKERGEVAGSTRKIKRQKGTGTARAGDIKNPIFRGGGITFGPKPRNYGFKLNKKVKSIARRSALSIKAADNNILVVKDFKFDSAKTKDYLKMLKNLKIVENKTLLVLAEDGNKNVYLSGRNLPKAEITTYNQLNIYDVLNAQRLILTENSVKKIEETFNN